MKFICQYLYVNLVAEAVAVAVHWQWQCSAVAVAVPGSDQIQCLNTWYGEMHSSLALLPAILKLFVPEWRLWLVVMHFVGFFSFL